MRVRCSLCDVVDTLSDASPLAKKLRNRPIHTYMCKECDDRITRKTEENQQKKLSE
ncbi:YlaI family protein [Bacillus fonticola]|uniref:YlaI family protein n=1 Tax=Bacillus fonticola TaxID=2728853 RepID=UPI00147587E7|nr:YlaI family protein [Bacillus fonticola]